jgi:hypothetical protein
VTITTIPRVISTTITSRLGTRRARRAYHVALAESARSIGALYGNTVAARRSVLLEQVATLEDELAALYPAAYGGGLDDVVADHDVASIRSAAALVRLYAATERAVDQAAFVRAGELQAGDKIWSVRDYAPCPVTAVDPGLDGGVWITADTYTRDFEVAPGSPYIYALDDLLPTRPVHIDVHAMAMTCGASRVEADLWWDLGATADRAERTRLLRLIKGMAATRLCAEAVWPLWVLSLTETGGPLPHQWMPPRAYLALLFAGLGALVLLSDQGPDPVRYALAIAAIGGWFAGLRVLSARSYRRAAALIGGRS